MGQIKLITSFIFISIFVIALISFAVNFAVDNNTAISLDDDDEYKTLNANLKGNVTVFYNDANASSDSIYRTSRNSQSDTTEGGLGLKTGPKTALTLAYSSIALSFSKIFGSGSEFGIIFTLAIALLTIIVGLYIYKSLWGNPD